MEERINPGKWTPEKVNTLLHHVSALSKTEEKIDFISGQFLNVPYRENTLTGSQNQPEIFTVNLEAADCFTFLDYVEAMRLSTSFNGFKSSLKHIRYKNGVVNFKHRNHFFINWREYNSDFVEDITASVGPSKQVDKELNDRGNGTLYVPGLACIKLTINYIPSTSVDENVIDKLKTGDYIGIYSDQPGLDVSHVGILIINNDSINLRHASQKYQKVVDEDFKEYIKNKPGIIVLRAKRSKVKTSNK
jgi:hypothetical protein